MLEKLTSIVTLFWLSRIAMRALIARPPTPARSEVVASGEATVALRPLAEIALLAHRDKDARLASGTRLARESCSVDPGRDLLGQHVEL